VASLWNRILWPFAEENRKSSSQLSALSFVPIHDGCHPELAKDLARSGYESSREVWLAYQFWFFY
jgi:hypothetical protein